MRLPQIVAQRQNQRVTALHKSISIRDLRREDLPFVGSIVDAARLFPSEMLEAMTEPYLSGKEPHHWLLACAEEQVLGFAYAEPERMTDGTFNLLAIAVDPKLQCRGVGAALVEGLEQRLRDRGGRVLIVETSSLQEFAGAREFYRRRSFHEEARVRDFYAQGEDKIIFWKRL